MTSVTHINSAKSKVAPAARYLQQFKVWRNRRQAMLQLSALSDTLLKDMGISRGEIYDVVHQRGDFAPVSKLTKLTPAPIVAEVHIKRAA